MNILVIAAHPDDEILGCGGTIARHTLQGDVVHLLILAEGATSRDFQRCRDQRQIELSALAQAAHQAGELLGVSSVTLHDFPDNRMDSCDLLDVTKMVEQAIEQHRPHLIYTHHGGDLNIDHRCVHSAVMTATRPVPNSSINQVLSFEVASSTEWQFYTSSAVFLPNWYVDISTTLNLKLQALEIYHSEMRPWPHARSLQAVEHLAKWRGASVGVPAAEAFMLIRNLIK